MKKSLYTLLGIEPDASFDEIKFAYRRKARETHPDKGGEKGEFEAVKFAYEVLSDPERRAEYDAFGTAEQEAIDPMVNTFATLFMQALMSMNQPKSPFDLRKATDGDVVATMQDMIENESESTERDLVEIRKDNEKTVKVRERLRGQGKAFELAKSILNDKLDRNKAALAERHAHLKELKELSAFIKDLAYADENETSLYQLTQEPENESTSS